MLGVGGAAAIAAEEKLAPGFEHRYSRFGERRRRLEQPARPLEDGKVFLIAAGEFSRHRGAVGFHDDFDLQGKWQETGPNGDGC